MCPQQFDVTTELANLRRHTKQRRQSCYQPSRLNKWRAELVTLSKAGASLREMTWWLRKQKRVRISHTTIMRYLKKLPELNPNHNVQASSSSQTSQISSNITHA